MKTIILSSGGVDSTTCLALAVNETESKDVVTLSVFYGQKHNKELECARKAAAYYGVKHYEFDLSEIMRYSDCPLLLDSTQKIQHKSYGEQITKENGMVSTYVPFRNGLFLSVAASLAMSLFPDEETRILIGAHGDDAAGNAYADCSAAFIQHMDRAIREGTYGKVRIEAPFARKNKAEVVRTGLALGTPYELTWSCYEGGDVPCGTCGTCIDRQKAFDANGVKDPAIHQR